MSDIPHPDLGYQVPMNNEQRAALKGQPDLRTLDGQLDYLDYRSPDDATAAKYRAVNEAAQSFWKKVGPTLPDGPGKTRALHALNIARMTCNSTIATEGA